MGDKFDIEIKQAFSKVKEDIFFIKNHLKELENKIKDQTQENEGLFKKINDVYEVIKGIKDSSTGNEGVKQSINQSLSNQSIIKQSINQSSTSEPVNGNNSVYNEEQGNEGVKQLSNHLSTNQSINQSLSNQSQDREEQIKKVTNKLNTAFLTLSKQELKLFLTIYQLEDENIIPTYKNISQKMQLSESCLRAHLSSLLRKNIPLHKTYFNNRIVQVSVSKEFRVLNLKQRLINLYYESDPHQKTLFDTII